MLKHCVDRLGLVLHCSLIDCFSLGQLTIFLKLLGPGNVQGCRPGSNALAMHITVHFDGIIIKAGLKWSIIKIIYLLLLNKAIQGCVCFWHHFFFSINILKFSCWNLNLHILCNDQHIWGRSDSVLHAEIFEQDDQVQQTCLSFLLEEAFPLEIARIYVNRHNTNVIIYLKRWSFLCFD